MRDAKGLFVSTRTPLERFLSFCRHDATTGCVVWTGGTTSGGGHSAPYGSFWFERRRWFAHRWSAKYIHGMDIEGHQVDHCCPHIEHPDTLCVEHVQSVPPAVNRELQWIRTQVGLLAPPPLPVVDPDAPPFFYPPQWLLAA